jgi:hypothetical protein
MCLHTCVHGDPIACSVPIGWGHRKLSLGTCDLIFFEMDSIFLNLGLENCWGLAPVLFSFLCHNCLVGYTCSSKEFKNQHVSNKLCLSSTPAP